MSHGILSEYDLTDVSDLNIYQRRKGPDKPRKRSRIWLPTYLTDFFENQPKKICSHLSEKASKSGRFLMLEKLQNQQ